MYTISNALARNTLCTLVQNGMLRMAISYSEHLNPYRNQW